MSRPLKSALLAKRPDRLATRSPNRSAGRRPIFIGASRSALLALTLAASPLAAGEVIGSIGIDDLQGDRAAAAGLELRSETLWSNAHAGVALGAAIEADSDLWSGAGPVLIVPLAQRWRLEGSLMLGFYQDGGGNSLGADFPMFRSQLGASYALADGWWVGLAFSHKSNAETARRNPGAESLFFSVARAF